jgi:hypothetical protein
MTTQLHGWFSQHPDAVLEQEIFIETLEHAGHDLLTMLDGKTEFGFTDARKLVESAGRKAWRDNCAWTRRLEASTEDEFVKKLVGTLNEDLPQAVINSRRFEAILPPGWVSCRHRAEFGIPDKQTGSPDRIIFSANGKLHSLLSCKSYGDHTKAPPNLERAAQWAVQDYPTYAGALGADPDKRVALSYWSDSKNKRGMIWHGGMVCIDTVGRTINDLLGGNNYTALNFWRDFFAEFKHNIMAYNARNVLSGPVTIFKKPDPFQQSAIVDPILLHTGPGILNGDCGIGKTVCQSACFESRYGIYLYMPGARLALAQQANEEFNQCFGFETHRVFVMSEQGWQKQVGTNLREELTYRAKTPMQLAQVLFQYMLSDDNRPMITMSTEQSLEKVYKALAIIRNGELRNEDGNLESWCEDPEKVTYWWNRMLDCLLDAHYDEAHNLVAAELKGDDTTTSKRKTRVQSHLMEMNNWFKRSIYWTATLKRNGSQFDMENKQVFGEVVSVVRPSESIRRGYTVPPWMIVVGLGQGPLISSGVDPSEDLRDPDKEVTYYIRAIEDALAKCQEINIPCRLLVFTSATTYHVAFCQRIREHFVQKDKKIWCNYVEAGTPADERKTLFTEFGSADFSVLLNYQIVHEGINIPSCTGVILGRYMNAVSLIQAIGRSRRLMPEDREGIRNGTIAPGDLANYKKPWGLVYHYLDENDADSRTAKENYKELIRELRDVNDGEPWWLDRAKADQLKPRGKRPPGYANPQPKTTDDAEAQYEDAFAKILYVDSSDLIRIENEERKWTEIEQIDPRAPDALKRLAELV